MNLCPLCQSTASPFFNNQFFVCQKCDGVFRPSCYLPDQQTEKNRYEEHNNDVNDLRYQKFVSPITQQVKQDFAKNTIGLDFGAGTGPVISKVLTDAGYTLKQYDPYFCYHPDLLNQQYDYIVTCEVIEHFHRPDEEFKLLYTLLKPNGKLYCMTDIYQKNINFEQWYYKNDPTHVFIYQHKTLDYIQKTFHFSSMVLNKRLIVLSK